MAVVGVPLAGPVTAHAREPDPPRIVVRSSVLGLGHHSIYMDGYLPGIYDGSLMQWLIDGKLVDVPPERFNVTPDGFINRTLDGRVRMELVKPRDGQQHTVTLRIPRRDTGETYETSTQFQAFKPLELTALTQSAATAREHGIAVRVSAARGYYRVRATSARIPAAGSVNFNARRGGARTIRLRGSYLDRIKPGTRLKVRAQRLYRGSVLEAADITVPFR